MSILKLFKRTKPEIGPNQKKFLDYLRNKDIKQGNGVLQRGNKFCVLGVACLAAEDSGVKVQRRAANGELWGAFLYPDQIECHKWLGLRKDGKLNKIRIGWKTIRRINSSGVGILKLNDAHQFSFSQIADIIEKHADKFFTEPK